MTFDDDKFLIVHAIESQNGNAFDEAVIYLNTQYGVEVAARCFSNTLNELPYDLIKWALTHLQGEDGFRELTAKAKEFAAEELLKNGYKIGTDFAFVEGDFLATQAALDFLQR